MNVLVLPPCICVPLTPELQLEHVRVGDLGAVGDIGADRREGLRNFPGLHWLPMNWKSRALRR